jgi:hypothetical protein
MREGEPDLSLLIGEPVKNPSALSPSSSSAWTSSPQNRFDVEPRLEVVLLLRLLDALSQTLGVDSMSPSCSSPYSIDSVGASTADMSNPRPTWFEPKEKPRLRLLFCLTCFLRDFNGVTLALAIGLVSIDRPRRSDEVEVGRKWFVNDMLDAPRR